MSWVGWRRFKAPHGLQRRVYSDQTFERSRPLVDSRVGWEAKTDEKLGFRRP